MVAKEEIKEKVEHSEKQALKEKKVLLNNVKNDFFDSNNKISWSLYVKGIDQAFVEFNETDGKIIFKTNDEKFLKANIGTDSNTTFECHVEFFDRVKVTSCAYKVDRQKMEITLHKQEESNGAYKKWQSPYKRIKCDEKEDVKSQHLIEKSKPQLVLQTKTIMDTPPMNRIRSRSRSISSSPSPPPSSTSVSSNSSSSSSNQQQQPQKQIKLEEISEITSAKPSTTTSTSSTTASSSTVKKIEYFGFSGLANLGNTCYMNAALQLLINAVDLRNYFIETPHQFQKEINTKNALGQNGDMAIQFAFLIRQLWTSKQSYLVPNKLRDLICCKYTHFRGYEQQDTQEFLFSLLSLLHEDLNRISKKPYYESSLECEDDSNQNTFDIACESWKRFLTRENSVIVDNFYGQFKSKLTCPECHKVSITFEPFSNLIVPLPKPKLNITFVLMFHVRRCKMPIESNVFVNENDTIEKVFQQVKQRFSYLKQSTLKAFLLQKKFNTIDQDEDSFYNQKQNEMYFETDWKILDVNDKQPHPLGANRFIVICETHIDQTNDLNDPKIELRFNQSCKYPSIPNSTLNKCSYCQKPNQKSDKMLPRCTRCFRSAYCNSECQKNDWQKHSKLVCPKPKEAIGLPFILSFKKSELFDSNGEEYFRQCLIDACLFTADVSKVNVTNDKNDDREDLLHISDYDIELLETDLLCKSSSPPTTAASSSPSSSSKTIFLKTYQDLLDIVDTRLNQKLPSKSIRLSINWKNQFNGVPTLNIKTNVSNIVNMISDSNDLDGRASITLNDCLKLFTHPEKLTSENPWYCSNCKKHQEATKQMSLWQLPKYLIITLKRFQATKAFDMSNHEHMAMNHRFNYILQNHVVYNKLNNLVDFPLKNLNMSKYVVNPMQDKKNCIYDLCGVINHLGQSLSIGHYTAYARTHSTEDTTLDELPWRLFDDQTVVQIRNDSQIVSKDAYVLMYRLRNKPSDDLIDSSCQEQDEAGANLSDDQDQDENEVMNNYMCYDININNNKKSLDEQANSQHQQQQPIMVELENGGNEDVEEADEYYDVDESDESEELNTFTDLNDID